MNNSIYTNLPLTQPSSGNDNTLVKFDTFYTQPLEIETGTFTAMKGFFTSKGFDDVSAESVAVTIIRQAKIDNLNPMQIIDTLRGLSTVEISALVAEIVNYNRFKTSFLGYALAFQPNAEVVRNVVA